MIPAQTGGEIADFCRRNGVKELYLFGSILNDEFDDQSDVDVMIEMIDPDALGSFEALFAMSDELEKIFERKVDLVSKKVVTSSANQHRKQSILGSARLVYPPRGTMTVGWRRAGCLLPPPAWAA